MKVPSGKQSASLLPPSSSLSSSSPFEHRVARAISACTRCRSRKSKCDGKLPACTSCAKANVECVGFDAISKKNVSRSYIHDLEQEVITLRARLGISENGDPAPPLASGPSRSGQSSGPTSSSSSPSTRQDHKFRTEDGNGSGYVDQPSIKIETSSNSSPPNGLDRTEDYDMLRNHNHNQGYNSSGGSISASMSSGTIQPSHFAGTSRTPEESDVRNRGSFSGGGMMASSVPGESYATGNLPIHPGSREYYNNNNYPPQSTFDNYPNLNHAGPSSSSSSRLQQHYTHSTSRSDSNSNSTPTQRDIDNVVSDIAFASREAGRDPRPMGHYMGAASGVSLTRMVLDAVLREGAASELVATSVSNRGRGRDEFEPAMSRADSPGQGNEYDGRNPHVGESSSKGGSGSLLDGFGTTSNSNQNGDNPSGSTYSPHHQQSRTISPPSASRHDQRPPISVPALPPPAAVDRLVQVYVDFVQIVYPILHMPTFHKQLARVRNRSADVQHADIFFVLMVLALSTMALSRSLDPTAELRMSSEAFYVEASKHMEALFEEPSYVGLEAILLCCKYSLFNPRRGSVWFLVGLASRICVDHGLHHETEHSTVSLSPLELDTRRRLFHIVYSLDRLLGNALGRPPSIPDEYIDVPFYSNLPDSAITEHGLLKAEPDPYKVVAINYIPLRELQSIIGTRLYSVRTEQPSDEWFATMFDRLKDWLGSSPEPRGAASTEGYAIAFHNTVLLLFRPSPACPRPSHDALATCLSSSSYVIRIFRTMQKKNKINWAWLACHHVFMAGITYLYGLWNMNLLGSVTPSLRDAVLDCQACLTTLEALAVMVPAARACHSTFEMLSTAIIRRLTSESTDDDHSERGPTTLGSTSHHAESAMRHSFQSNGLPSPLPKWALPAELGILDNLFMNPMMPHPKASASTTIRHPSIYGSEFNGDPSYNYGLSPNQDYSSLPYVTTPSTTSQLQGITAETPNSMHSLAAAAASLTPSSREQFNEGSETRPPTSHSNPENELAASGFDFLTFLAADDGGQGANAVWEQTESFRHDIPMIG